MCACTCEQILDAVQPSWVQILAPLPTHFVALGKLLNVSVPQFLHQ